MQIYKKNIFQKNSANVILDTLAQPRKSDKSRLLKRARSKYFTSIIALPLADLKNELEKYYRNAYYCNYIIIQEHNKLTSKYCNTRICNVCNRIRTMKLINGYSVPLQALDGYFVTLTIPNVTGIKLKVTVTNILEAFAKIQNRLRFKNIKLKGLRKLEITYNEIANTYHPHFHLIIDTESNANTLVTEWLKEYPKAKSYCQDVRKADSDSVKEMFKYVTKIVTKRKNKPRAIYIQAIDTIMKALYKRRTFQTFGGIKMVSEDINELKSEYYDEIEQYDFIQWIWQDTVTDWVNEYGEQLTGYEPSEALNKIKIYK